MFFQIPWHKVVWAAVVAEPEAWVAAPAVVLVALAAEECPEASS